MIVKAAQIQGSETLKGTSGYNWITCHHSNFANILGQAAETCTFPS